MKKYQIIYADPPWSYSDKGCNGNCEAHYKTMRINDICKLPVRNITDTNCVLFLWTTYPMLKEAMLLIDAWGFEYKSIAFQWLKLNKSSGQQKSFFKEKYFFGLGRWTRGNTEPCLLAVKGKPKRVSASVHQIIEAPVTRHSAKPPETREKIEKLLGSGLTKIELFARNRAEGWDVWGNEVDSDITLGC